MDLNTAGGAFVITVLRLLHIVGGLVWVGAALVMALYIEPALEQAGEAGNQIIRRLYRETSFPRLIPLSALATTAAGLLLYGLLAYHETLSSGTGLMLNLGALLGLLAFGHGYFAVWRPAGAYAVSSDADTKALGDKLRRQGRISVCLAMLSLLLMAGARYAGPLLG